MSITTTLCVKREVSVFLSLAFWGFHLLSLAFTCFLGLSYAFRLLLSENGRRFLVISKTMKNTQTKQAFKTACRTHVRCLLPRLWWRRRKIQPRNKTKPFLHTNHWRQCSDHNNFLIKKKSRLLSGAIGCIWYCFSFAANETWALVQKS